MSSTWVHILHVATRQTSHAPTRVALARCSCCWWEQAPVNTADSRHLAHQGGCAKGTTNDHTNPASCSTCRLGKQNTLHNQGYVGTYVCVCVRVSICTLRNTDCCHVPCSTSAQCGRNRMPNATQDLRSLHQRRHSPSKRTRRRHACSTGRRHRQSKNLTGNAATNNTCDQHTTQPLGISCR